MNFKRMNFLLIMLALVLLVGIGSVSAASDDGADIISDSITDDMLLDDGVTEGNDPADPDPADPGDSTETEKINTTVESENLTARDNETASISVTVKYNESQEISVSESDLNVTEGNETVEFTYNGTINIIAEKLGLGNHTLLIAYLGNDTYAASNTTITLSIFGNKTMNVPENVSVNDTKTVEIPIEVTNGVNATSFDSTNTNVTLFYKDGEGNYQNKSIELNEGQIIFTEENSLVSAYVTINYYDEETNITKMVNIAVQTNITVSGGRFKDDEDISLQITIKDIYGSDVANESNITVYEGNNTVTSSYADGYLNITGLSVGNHTLTVSYMENENYTASSCEILVQVYENKTMNVADVIIVNETNELIIPVTVSDGTETYELNESNANVTVYFKDGTNKTVSGWTYENGAINFTEEDNLVFAYLIINYNDGEFDLNETVNIKIQTVIEAIPVSQRVNENEEVNITVALSDIYDSVELTEDNLTVYEGNKSIGFTYADGKITLSEALSAGNHTLTIAYKGSHDYADSSADVDISIIGDWRIELQDLTAIDENNNATLTINITNSVDYLEVAVGELSLNLTYVNASGDINTVTINDFIISDNVIEFNVPSDFTSGNLTVVYNETSNNLLANATVKTGTIITSENVTSLANDTFSFKINVTDIHGNEITISLDDLEVLCDGKALSKATYNESVITVNDQINTGIHNITLKYKGDDTYFASEKIIVLTMFEIVTPSSIDVNSTKIAILPVNVTDGNTTYELGAENLTVTVSYLDENNETKTVTISNFSVENNTATFPLDDNNFTSGNLTICYNGIYNKTITLNNIINVIISPINTTGYYQSGNLTFKVTDADTGNILTNKSVQIQYKYETIRLGLSSFTTDEKGMIYFNLNKGYSMMGYFLGSNYFTVGVHELIFIGEGQLKGENNTNITISKANVIIIADKFTRDYGTTDKFKITVVSAETGELMKDVLLSLYMPQTTAQNYTVKTNENGTCEITVSGLVGGDYNVTVSTIDNNTNNASTNSSIVINKVKVKIDTSSKTMYYNSGSTAKITIKNAKTGKAVAGVYVFVRLYTSSTKYNDYLFMTNSKGVVEFSAPLNVGKHKMIVATADARYEGSSVTKTITVKNAPAKITAAKKTAYYKQGKYFVVKVTNTKNNKPIYNAKLNIRVFVTSTKYYNFNGRTGANGQIKLSMDLKPGTYNVVIIDKDSNMVAKQATSKMVIKKAPAKFSAPKVTAKKKANKYFKVKVTNKKTKKIIPGVKVKVKVYTGKKSKTYTIKTNSKGIAKLSTKSLKVGKHNVVITSANKYVKASKKTSSIKITK